MRTMVERDVVRSTNDVAAELVRSGAVALPLAVWAHRQTRGRGRGSHEWWSDAGSLTFTMAIDPAAHGLAQMALPRVALATAVAVIDAVGELGFREHGLGIRWPNDVECGGRKLGGILPEIGGAAGRRASFDRGRAERADEPGRGACRSAGRWQLRSRRVSSGSIEERDAAAAACGDPGTIRGDTEAAGVGRRRTGGALERARCAARARASRRCGHARGSRARTWDRRATVHCAWMTGGRRSGFSEGRCSDDAVIEKRSRRFARGPSNLERKREVDAACRGGSRRSGSTGFERTALARSLGRDPQPGLLAGGFRRR